MRPFLFLLGAPGAGKTTVTRALLGPKTAFIDRWTIGARFAAAGPYTGAALDGPDSLPFSRALLAKVLERGLQLQRHTVPILEGERFAAAWALEALKGRAQPRAVLLNAAIPTLRSRRAKRGSPPVPDAWYQRRIEACERTLALFPEQHILAPELPVNDVVALVAGWAS
jgi:hypothetical protein